MSLNQLTVLRANFGVYVWSLWSFTSEGHF